ncbi:SDR family NAD(P)-dependent oxidoreductase [Rhodocytophaga aerolata]|uniref:SDR family NAD(P)-dependent oxidoreductase n=1 Tax=Rhodocytophaga aerolata TaxID=455078 RepID=A0ABT8QZX1_9BACT|nr:SDR family NAD(P)-dependent oxidoreductase [Rhodocytophaga aerolata]MDO1445396.1 SDR family NAD(P)-dependent oxidoreductase [Rhodocytophaga aerolata]
MEQRLKNKVAIVTGGGAGIGEAICKKFALNGAKVVVCGFPDDPVEAVAQEIAAKGGTAIAYKGDISMAEHARMCVETAIETWGKLDILINNAGVFPVMETIDSYPTEAFQYLVKNNIQSTFMMTKFAIPHLQKTKGNIVSAGSESGLLGIAENAPYGGTKGFIHAFIKGVAVEQAQYGVRANVVCPGAIDTAWTHKETGPMSTKTEKMVVEATPMGRRGTPEEVANVYLFLASDEASYVTGSLYSVDGGVTINKGATGSMADDSMKSEPAGELNLKHSMEGDTAKNRFANTYGYTPSSENNSNAITEALHANGGQLKNSVSKALVGLSAGLAVAGMVWNLTRKGRSNEEEFGHVDEDVASSSGQSGQENKSAAPSNASSGWEKKMDENPANNPANNSLNNSGGSKGGSGFTNEGATGNAD